MDNLETERSILSDNEIYRRESQPDRTTEKIPQENLVEDEKPDLDVPPDGGYGWVCVVCVFWINAHSWGINSTYGVFLSYYLSHNVFPDTSELTYAFTGGLSISCALLMAPIATYMIRTWGTRVVLNLGVFFQTLSLISSSFATQKWHIILSQGVCFGCGMGFLFVGTIGVIPQWFVRRRGFAMGITAGGSGLGGLVYSLAVGALLSRFGIGWAFRVLAICSFVVNLICANLIKDRNKAVGSRFRSFHLPLFKRPEFVLYLAWGFLSMLGYVALLFSVADYALSIGLSSHQASVVSALLNLGQGLGRPFVGIFSDKIGRINVATLLTFLCGLFCLVIWIFARTMGVVCFFAVLVGTVSGTFWATVAPVLAEIIGLRELPSGLSISWMVLIPPTTVSEAIALMLRTNSSKDHAYLRVQIFAGFMYIGAACCLWIVRGWKLGELAHAEQQSLGAEGTSQGPTCPRNEMENQPNHQGDSMSGLWSPASVICKMVALKRV
ncbi:hypothetical protein ASPZODRAFT_112211 [Penicilliopsis zonata CBS 506.65]|uniref:Major facilitator superfamily (MFS) profile domain-containing protein n=1 Tax=Penicilliopsis zonata CBS 506.65 TaxID=1073090 RepID=A0A1L9SQD1_9EURO|nr:hypothetical protein ASPZODRAFT_112211 [Penicilliopsis zonata CBS 506.65]OJJ49368.1 hypothetical protein ASPZODRAFT_112211 [Penicilliopsis zonata CBS 506.65]